MNTGLLDSIPLLVVTLGFAVISFAFYEIGFRVGLWWQARMPGEQEGPTDVLVGSLLALMAFLLAVTMSMAADRFDTRRGLVVAEANAIGTTYLRAQLLAEPARTRSLALLREYTDLAIRLSHDVPNSSDMQRTAAAESEVQRSLWRHAGEAMDAAPVASAPRLYVDSLNSMIDMQTVRVSGLNNRVPGAVLALEVIGAAAALGLLGLYLSVLGRGVLPVVLASALVSGLLLVTFDLDRPVRGLITVPSTPLETVRASMALPPAAGP